MALRTRVPKRKALTGGHRQRNKNPKLSPYQREQKRTRLANQPPTVFNSAAARDFPKSARGFMDFINKKKEREQLHRVAVEQAKASGSERGVITGDALAADAAEGGGTTAAAVAHVKKSKNKYAHLSGGGSGDAGAPRVLTMGCAVAPSLSSSSSPTPPLSTATSATSKKQKVVGVAGTESQPLSLNGEIRDERLGAVKRIDEEKMLRIQRKKLKKHAKKVAAKREKRHAELAELEEKLKEETVSSVKKKALKRREKEMDPVEAETRRLEELNAARERQQRVTDAVSEHFRIEKARNEATASEGGGDASGAAAAAEDESSGRKKKRISFDDSVEAPGEGEHRPMRFPGDVRKQASMTKSKERLFGFEERVDVVRFGERVEAPPVFDRLPKAGHMSALGAKLLEEDGVFPASALPKKRAKLGDLSAAKGSQLGLYEHKRLSKLGLVDAATQRTPLPAGNDGAVTTAQKIALNAAEKAKEMEALRAQVMASYRKGKGTVTSKGGQGMFKHAFPTGA